MTSASLYRIPSPPRPRARFVWLALWVALAGAGGAQATHEDTERIQWACGPGGSGQGGHPDRCGIDPIGGGEPVDAAGDVRFGEDWLEDDEQVLGIVIDGDARAYPVKVLDRHEIVNDVVAGRPVAVTYCPLCGSGVTFDRVVQMDGTTRELTFTASGFLFKHDLVMWDPETGTLWTQILGEPIGSLRDERVEGSHAEATLQVIPTQLVAWADWKATHPDSRLLSPLSGRAYGGAYAGYDENCRYGISRTSVCDVDGLHPKEQVVGVTLDDGQEAAFPLFALRSQGAGLVPHEGKAILASADERGLVQAYDATGIGLRQTDGNWVDEQGRTWDVHAGVASDGARLAPANHVVSFWFAWKEHHPGTALWAPDGAPVGQKPLEDQSSNGLAIAAGALALLAVAGIVRRRWS